MKIQVPYSQVDRYWRIRHYDLTWEGLCIYNGQLAYFTTEDRTDYDTMTDSCPCCKEGGSNDWKECHCKCYTDVISTIETLSLPQRIKWYIKKWYWENITLRIIYFKMRKQLK